MLGGGLLVGSWCIVMVGDMELRCLWVGCVNGFLWDMRHCQDDASCLVFPGTPSV